MKKFEELSLNEQNEIVELFANWLNGYTHEVVVKVMEKADEIINSEFAMALLKELKERKENEYKDFSYSIKNLMTNFDKFKEYDVHNNPLQHSGSYKDVLYDMYIR